MPVEVDEDGYTYPPKAILRVYVGWDPRDHEAFTVAVNSLLAHTTIPVRIIPLIDRDLRKAGIYWRSYRVDAEGQMWDDRDGKPFSTQFSFTRFAVPILEDYRNDWVVFIDADVMFRRDIAELMGMIDRTKAINVVKHDHRPEERTKMDGVLQTAYDRKNWSSVMAINPSRCRGLTKYVLNNQTGASLHGFCWVDDADIGALDAGWNWLDGYSDPNIDPGLVHFTLGTPDMGRDSAFADEWMRYFESGFTFAVPPGEFEAEPLEEKSNGEKVEGHEKGRIAQGIVQDGRHQDGVVEVRPFLRVMH